MQPLLPWPVLASALAVSIPVSLGTAALLATRGSRWRIAMLASGASVAAALAVGATVLVGRVWG